MIIFKNIRGKYIYINHRKIHFIAKINEKIDTFCIILLPHTPYHTIPQPIPPAHSPIPLPHP